MFDVPWATLNSQGRVVTASHPGSRERNQVRRPETPPRAHERLHFLRKTRKLKRGRVVVDRPRRGATERVIGDAARGQSVVILECVDDVERVPIPAGCADLGTDRVEA